MDSYLPIVMSAHALRRMEQRGASREEVGATISNAEHQPAQRGKWQARQTFSFESLSPINGKHYRFKTLEVVFAKETQAITVVTTKVFYHN